MSAKQAHDSNEMDDLGIKRYEQDTAAVVDRDTSLYANGPVLVRQGRVPAGLEQQAFAWSTFEFETEERDGREELKGDLHGGQLHRQNRAARGELKGPPPPEEPRRGRKGGGMSKANGKTGQGGQGGQGELEPMRSGVKIEGLPQLARGKPEELDDDLFWDEPIC